MKNHVKELHQVWDQSADIITARNVTPNLPRLDEIMAAIFCPGPFYYYIVDFHDRQIKFMTPAIREVLGMDPQTVNFNDILANIHPEDMPFVAKAEESVLHHLYEEIGRDVVKDYKMSYCFRMKVADGTYHLFQHQAIILNTDEYGGFAQSLNIHTDINHLSTQNSLQATIMSIRGNNSFIQFNLNETVSQKMKFTPRELQVLRMLAKGLNSENTSNLLNISLQTVKIHRKNILRKSPARNMTELIAICIHQGIL